MNAVTKSTDMIAAALMITFLLVTMSPTQARVAIVATIAQIGEPLSVITEGRAHVETLMGEGVDPHLYRLTRSDVIRLNRADMIVFNGLHLEAQMADMLRRFSRRKPVIGVANTLKDQAVLLWDGKAHDPHVWMDPSLWITALSVAIEALAKIDPPNGQFYRANANAYFKRLHDLHIRAKKAMASIPPASRVLITAHDAFGYFGRAFAIDVMAVQGVSTESEAGIRRIEFLVDALVQRRIGAVFVETTVSDRNIRALIEGANTRNHRVRVAGPLYSDAMGRKGTYVGEYLGMLDHNVTTIVRALGGIAPKHGFGGQLATTGTAR